MNLNGATAIITGGGRGIGGAAALALAKEGCNVVVADNVAERVDTMTDQLKTINPKCSGLVVDLSKESGINELVEKTVDQYGTIDILINGAGACIPRNFSEITIQEWDLVLGINVRAVFIIGQKVMKIMEAQKSGHIINFSSSAVAYPTPYFHATYGASKHAVSALTQAMQDYGRQFGVKVSAVLPGPVDNGMTREMEPVDNFGIKGWSDSRPKFLKDGDIVEGILFLLKQPERAITRNLFIDASFI